MYKVVRIIGKNKRRSCVMSKIMGDNSNLIIKYPVKIWIKPNLGKIFVFKELIDAQQFASAESGPNSITEVWKCEVKNPEKIYTIAAVNSLDIKFFWKGGAFIAWDASDGTYICDAVKLIKKVE